MKMSANACRTIGSSELRMVAAPCVSMSIRTSTPFFRFDQHRLAQCAVIDLRAPARAPENRRLRVCAMKICVRKEIDNVSPSISPARGARVVQETE